MEFSKPKEFNGSEKTIKTTCISATQTLLALYASKHLKVYVCLQMLCLVFIFHRLGPSVHADQRVEDSACAHLYLAIIFTCCPLQAAPTANPLPSFWALSQECTGPKFFKVMGWCPLKEANYCGLLTQGSL